MDANLGLKQSDLRVIAERCDAFLADTYLLYLKTQNFHWNVTGSNFFEYHLLFEKEYKELALMADDLAERIRTLGYRAPGSFKDFMKLTQLEEDTVDKDLPSGPQMILVLERDHERIAKSIRDFLPECQKVKDEGTYDLLVKQLGQHEKAAWMLRNIISAPKDVVDVRQARIVS